MIQKKAFFVPRFFTLLLALSTFSATAMNNHFPGNHDGVSCYLSTGTISGFLTDWDSHADKVIIYAYQKGTFDPESEMQLQFKNAVTSAALQEDGSYELHLLEAGDYELFFAAYQDEDQDGQFELKGGLSFEQVDNIDLSSVSVGTEGDTRIDLNVVGILSL